MLEEAGRLLAPAGCWPKMRPSLGHAGAGASDHGRREAEAAGFPDQCAQHPEWPLEDLARISQHDRRQGQAPGWPLHRAATMFAEPDRNTSKPVVNRWFGGADGLPFFFAGIWREWQGDVGTIKQPNVGLHRLYSILTTEPNGVVQPIHNKAMPVMLMTAEDVDVWLNGTLEEALKLQKPQPDDALVITPYDEKKAA